jgi:hypothetical protein
LCKMWMKTDNNRQYIVHPVFHIYPS